MEAQHVAFSRRESARVALARIALLKRRAQGMPGAGRAHGPPATKKQAAVTTGSARTSGIPRATVLTAASRSPWCAGLVSHHRLANPACRAPRADIAIPQSLIPASGNQDHTTWPSATHCTSGNMIASTASRAQHSWRSRSAPLEGTGCAYD